MTKDYANDAPRSEFLSEDATRMAKFMHYGRKGLRGAKSIALVKLPTVQLEGSNVRRGRHV